MGILHLLILPIIQVCKEVLYHFILLYFSTCGHNRVNSLFTNQLH